MHRQRKIFLYKSILAVTTGLLFLGLATPGLTQETSKSETTKEASPSAVNEDKVKALKEKLATKVAELRENQKRGFFGEIATLTKTGFTLVVNDSELKIKYTPDDTLFYKVSKSLVEAKSDDLKNGLTATVLGLYDEETKQDTAKAILLQTVPTFIKGEITAIDKKGAVITIKNSKNEPVDINYESTTTAEEFDMDTKKLVKSGLSRLAESDHVQIWGTVNEDDAEKFDAVRMIRLPKELFTKNTDETNTATSSAGPSPSESTKASPSSTTKASPSTTPKTSPKSSASPKASV